MKKPITCILAFGFSWFAIWWSYHLSDVKWIQTGQVFTICLLVTIIVLYTFWILIKDIDL